MKRTLVKGGTIVNEGRRFTGTLVIENDRIKNIIEGEETSNAYDELIDAEGCFVFPGIIDTHVHFREPGLTYKADIESETRAAAYGGVTTFFDMPNTIPQATTREAIEEKLDIASHKSHINYSFFYGATNNNYQEMEALDFTRIPGIKLFMGASTGNMLVDRYGALLKIFETAARLNIPVITHCEDSDIIARNMAEMKKVYGDDPEVYLHPLIRSEEACFDSTSLAIVLARTYGTRLHVAHLSTAKELKLFGKVPHITAEATIGHLYFTQRDYFTRGSLIKCNPSVKSENHRLALRNGLTDDTIYTVATDHAPHRLSDKKGGAAKAASGMPLIQFSLPVMLSLHDQGILSLERIVELMAHHPATLFQISERGFLRPGYKADITIVKRVQPWTLTRDMVQSKCGWSPLEGETFHWQVDKTLCNGQLVYDQGRFFDDSQGQEIIFRQS